MTTDIKIKKLGLVHGGLNGPSFIAVCFGIIWNTSTHKPYKKVDHCRKSWQNSAGI